MNILTEMGCSSLMCILQKCWEILFIGWKNTTGPLHQSRNSPKDSICLQEELKARAPNKMNSAISFFRRSSNAPKKDRRPMSIAFDVLQLETSKSRFFSFVLQFP